MNYLSNSQQYMNTPYGRAQVLPISLDQMFGGGQSGGRSSNEMQTLAYQASRGIYPNGKPGTGVLSAQGLFDMQTAENLRARTENQNNYNEAKTNILGTLPRYASDPMTAASRGLASGLMANPEALNDQTQQKIINRGRTAIDSQVNALMSQGRDQLAQSGQLTTGNMRALQDQAARQRIAGLVNQGTTLDITRANQRNADITNAANLGRGMGMDRANLDLGVSQAWMLPQVKPDNYAGMAALLPEFRQSYSYGGGLSGPGNSSRFNYSSDPAQPGFGNNLFNLGAYSSQKGGLSPGQTGVQTPYYYNQDYYGMNGRGIDPRYSAGQPGWGDLAYGGGGAWMIDPRYLSGQTGWGDQTYGGGAM